LYCGGNSYVDQQPQQQHQTTNQSMKWRKKKVFISTSTYIFYIFI